MVWSESLLCPGNRTAGHRCLWHVSYMHTFAPPSSCTVLPWAEPRKGVTSAPCGSPCSTEPAAYPRVQFPWNPTCSPQEELKRPESVPSLESTAAAPCVCWQISWRGSPWHTSHSVPVKWLGAENCTCSDLFRLDLSLINKPFAWADHTMSSERW